MFQVAVLFILRVELSLGVVTGGQDQTKPGYRTCVEVVRRGQRSPGCPSECSCAGTGTAGLAPAALPASTHPTAATPEPGHRAGGTELMAQCWWHY